MSTPTKFPARREQDAEALVQHRRRSAGGAAGAAPGHDATGRPGRPAPLFPDELIPGGQHRARRCPFLSRCARCSASGALAADPRAPPRKALGTPAKIYYKYEGVSPAGSHKPNTAVPQAWYNAQAGIKKIATETGAGQWGSSLAFAGALFGIDVTAFQVRMSYDQKPYRRALMETWGARCIASPSKETNSGCAILAAEPRAPRLAGHRHLRGGGVAATHDDTKYALGSVLNHVLLHQTIIGPRRSSSSRWLATTRTW